MAIKIVLFEDDPEYGARLPEFLRGCLGGMGEVNLFRAPANRAENGTLEERLEADLVHADYKDATIFVADRDLSRTRSYGGMSEATVKRVADKIGIPECSYARGEPAVGFEHDAGQREARIALSLTADVQAFASRVVGVAEGFTQVAERLSVATRMGGKKTLSKILAEILGKPEYADKIALYASGDLARLDSILKVKGTDTQKQQRLQCILGYWLWDSVLRFPGVTVGIIPASSYLNIEQSVFENDPAVQALFGEALYEGPFAKAKVRMWWRGMLDDLIAKSGCRSGNEFVRGKLNREIPPSRCCEDASISAGYYCMLSEKPVSLANSKGGLPWFPRGADLARVSKQKLDELGPWI